MLNGNTISYKVGINCLEQIRHYRLNICNLEQIIHKSYQAMIRTKADSLWQNIYDDSQKQLEELNERLMNLDQMFCVLKMECSSSVWKKLLIKKGYIIAETTNIRHVKDNMTSELELTEAINMTVSTVEHLKKNLADAISNNYEDDQIMLNAEIKWFINDLKKHHWGRQALTHIDIKNNNLEIVDYRRKIA